MKIIFDFFSLFLVIKSIDFVNSQFFNPNRQQFGDNHQCPVDDYGTFGTCRSVSECRGVRNFEDLNLCRNSRFGPIVCCPLRNSNRRGGPGRRGGPRRRVGHGRRGGPNRRGWHNANGQRENIQALSLSQRKCQQLYFSNNRFKRDEVVFRPAVVGGQLTQAEDFPFMAAIGWKNTAGSYDYNCGGFLVTSNFVITAAHCTTLRGEPPTVVKAGGGNLDNPGEAVDIPISRIIPHPSYNSGQSYNDIAVIQITASNLPYMPACLWTDSDINHQEATAIGYGHTSFAGQRSSDLLEADLNIVSNEACSQYYPPGSSQMEKGLDQSQLCTGDPDRAKDTCQGDSGGLILIRITENGITIPYVIGVTSLGQGCAGAAPSIYTRISSYTRWIESIIWPDES